MKKIIIFKIFILVGFCVFLLKYSVNVESYGKYYDVSSIKEIIVSRDGNGSFLINNNVINFDITNVTTPNGSSIEVFHTLNDMSFDSISGFNDYYDNLYEDATRLYSASARYNCHSYAWYSQNTSTNVYWMNDPSDYYNDYSYDEVNTPRPGDIVCYYDNNGTQSDYSDDENIHSGIVFSIDSTIPVNNVCGNVNQIMVKSKWGPAGLYLHRGDYCPYVSSFGGKADYVKYYRPRTSGVYSLPSDSPIIKTFYAYGSDVITDNYEMYELNANYGYYEISVSSNHPLDVFLYDEHMHTINVNHTHPGTYTDSFIKCMGTGRYYLRVSYQNLIYYGTITTQISNHIHNYTYTEYNSMKHRKSCSTCGYASLENHHIQYINGNEVCSDCGYSRTHQHSHDDHYQWTSLTNHKSYCICGNYINDFHVVSPDAYQNGNQYAICLLCNGFASVGGTWHDGIGSFPYTLNGSFILPNGVIVLEEADMEAYLNGTLVFINPNENIDRCNNQIPCIIRREDEYIID